MPKLDINERYIVIRMDTTSTFDDESLHTVWVDKDGGIQEVIGKTEDGKPTVHSYLFDKNKWGIEAAREWLRTKTTTNAEHLNSNRLFVTSSMQLCSSLPKLLSAKQEDMPVMERTNKAFAELYDKYYYYVEGVHEGTNANGAHFFAEELTANYKTMADQPIDWEHLQNEIIGMSQEVELVSHPQRPLAVGYSGVLWRTSPYMQVQERVGDKVMTRDELVKQRYLKDVLASSMECSFDRIECMECHEQFDDWISYEFHKWERHRDLLESNIMIDMGLRGVSFVGNGIVEFPADQDAYVKSLRTGEDNTLQEIDASMLVNRYGLMAKNVVFSQEVARAVPTDYVLPGAKCIFASEKFAEINPNNKNNSPINTKESDILDDTTQIGETIMFELLKKVSKSKDLNEALAKCQQILRDFKGDSELTEEDQKAFASEVSAVVSHYVSQENFDLPEIYEVTNKAKADAIEAARGEEIAKAEALLAEKEAAYTKVTEENEALRAAIDEKDAKILEMETADAEKELDKKVDAFMSDLKDSGVELAEVLAVDVRASVRTKLTSDNAEQAIKDYRKALLASMARENLANASNSAGVSPSGADNPASKSLEDMFEEIKAKYEQS